MQVISFKYLSVNILQPALMFAGFYFGGKLKAFHIFSVMNCVDTTCGGGGIPCDENFFLINKIKLSKILGLHQINFEQIFEKAFKKMVRIIILRQFWKNRRKIFKKYLRGTIVMFLGKIKRKFFERKWENLFKILSGYGKI